MKKKRAERQHELLEILKADPFYTDEELANRFEVSIQTIRLDRMSLNIPELRERVKLIAESQETKVKTLGVKEITGEIIDLSVGEIGISMLEITEDMIYSKTGTLKDHYIFSLAESLAMAIIDAPKVIMRVANIKCLKLIEKEDRLIAKAEIYREVDRKHYIKVVINNRDQEQIFRGKFIFEEID
ncbi:transcription factor FapR [Peptacetobacter hominis]|uniref:Transcription factor FapR n=1 Tax=Peptacetobacter hominis TaxID=2743610 RepID=A0A544QVH6_9FIRM|nr:transcription factor FapR [Peptacetobacter hominis]TQQ84670.1 transcription factor FapR [Peptacetobacter hominis]